MSATAPVDDVQQMFGPAVEKEFAESLEMVAGGLPDNGAIYRMPDGSLVFKSSTYSTTNQQEIKDILQSHMAGEPVDASKQAVSRFQRDVLKQIPEPILLGQQYTHGLPYVGSWADEKISENPAENWTIEKLRKAYKEEFPERAIPAELTGTLTGSYLGLKSLEKIAQLKKFAPIVDRFKKWYADQPPAGQVLTQAGTGTVLTTTEGAMHGSGDRPEDRSAGALEGAQTGIMVGGPLSLAFPILSRVISGSKFPEDQAKTIATEFGITIETARLIRDAMNAGGSLEEILEEVARAGDSKMIADMNEFAVRLLDASKTASPEAGEIVTKQVGERVEQTSKELARDIDETFGVAPEGHQTTLEAIQKGTAPQRGEAYKKAYSTPIDYASKEGFKVMEALGNIDPQYINRATKIAEREYRLAIQQGKELPAFEPIVAKTNPKTGLTEIDGNPSVFQLDIMKRELDKIVQADKQMGKFQTAEIETLSKELNQLRSALKDASPAYKQALSVGQSKIFTEQALDFGRSLLTPKVTMDDVKIALRDASLEEQKAIKQAVRQHIDNVMANAKTASTTGRAEDVSETMKVITDMSSRASREKMKLVLGDKTAEAFYKRLDEARKALELQAGVRAGSQTAGRKEIIEQVQEQAKGGFVKSLLSSADVKRTVQELRDVLMGREGFISGQADKVWVELAQTLTSSKIAGKDVETALKYLNDVRQGKNLTEAQANWFISAVRNAIASPATPMGITTGTERVLDED